MCKYCNNSVSYNDAVKKLIKKLEEEEEEEWIAVFVAIG